MTESTPATADALEAPALSITYQRVGNRGVVVLTVRLGDQAIAAEELNVLDPAKRGGFIMRLRKGRPGIDRKAVEAELLRIAADIACKPEAVAPSKMADPLAETPEHVKADALAMLRDPRLIQRVVDDIAALGVAGEKTLGATTYLIGTSRLLTRPLAGIVQGLTSSGKSYVVERTAALFPPEAVIRAHKMTPEALVHLPKGALVHRFVVGGERSRRQDDDDADATKALREILSDGRLTKLIPMKKQGNVIETVQIDQPGPIAYVESTTLQTIRDEDRNRCIVLNTDERPAQTRRIIDTLAERKANPSASGGTDAIIARHHAAQRMLKHVRVAIPFAPRLAGHFPDHRTDARRAFGHLLSMIEAVAVLHQHQRTTEPADDVEIRATADDYAIARHLLAGPFARTQSGGLSDAARRFYERLVTYGLGESFTTADVAKRESVIGDVQTIRHYVRALADAGYLEQTEEGRGNKPARYKVAASPPDDADTAGLPDIEVVFGDEPDSSARHRVEAQGIGVK